MSEVLHDWEEVRCSLLALLPWEPPLSRPMRSAPGVREASCEERLAAERPASCSGGEACRVWWEAWRDAIDGSIA